PPRVMRLRMTASVTLHVGDKSAATVGPLTALGQSEGNPVVFAVDPARKTGRRTPVTVAGLAAERAMFGTRRNPGELVVIAGVQFLGDAMPVRLLDEPRPAPG